MRLADQFQGQTVNDQGYRRTGAYRVGRTRRPHYLLLGPLARRGDVLFLVDFVCYDVCYSCRVTGKRLHESCRLDGQ